MSKIYLIGSMRTAKVQQVANDLRHYGWNVFDDWHSSGPESDEFWRQYEESRGRSYIHALRGLYAEHVFNFDLKHLQESDAAVLVSPAGRSAYLELGWMLGKGKPGIALVEESPERWDVMLQFATAVVDNVDDVHHTLEEHLSVKL
jgi:hypothetical protein